MKHQIKKRWVEALRSGKYKQGKDYLCRDGDFCCLGVLCELAVEDGVIPEPAPSKVQPRPCRKDGVFAYGAGFDYMPPPEVCDWAGVDPSGFGVSITLTDLPLGEESMNKLGRIPNIDNPSLPELNDAGCDFGLIADIIENHF
jgi:hypothetical protein